MSWGSWLVGEGKQGSLDELWGVVTWDKVGISSQEDH